MADLSDSSSGREAAIQAVRDYAGGWEDGEPEALVDAIGASLLAECIEASKQEVRRQVIEEIERWVGLNIDTATANKIHARFVSNITAGGERR